MSSPNPQALQYTPEYTASMDSALEQEYDQLFLSEQNLGLTRPIPIRDETVQVEPTSIDQRASESEQYPGSQTETLLNSDDAYIITIPQTNQVTSPFLPAYDYLPHGVGMRDNNMNMLRSNPGGFYPYSDTDPGLPSPRPLTSRINLPPASSSWEYNGTFPAIAISSIGTSFEYTLPHGNGSDNLAIDPLLYANTSPQKPAEQRAYLNSAIPSRLGVDGNVMSPMVEARRTCSLASFLLPRIRADDCQPLRMTC
jgi:hypothetical protein